MQEKKLICGLCACNCILKAIINEDGSVKEVKGDPESITGGFACSKGRALTKIPKAKNRITEALVKQKDGSFKSVTMLEALELLAQKMLAIKQDFGASAFAIHSGQAAVRRQFSRLTGYFSHLYGSVNYSGIGTTCNVSKRIAYTMTMGGLPKCDYLNAKTIVLWGHNAPNTHPYDWQVIKNCCANGAKLIIINPQKTEACREGCLHLALKPGTDIYLAWAILKIAAQQKWFTEQNIAATSGFEALVSSLKNLDTAEMLDHCGLTLPEVNKVTKLIFQATPTTIMAGTAIELQQHGFQTARAIAIIQAMCGTKALLFPKMPPAYAPFPVKSSFNGEMVGATEYPVFTDFVGYAQSNILSKSINEGKIKGILIVGGNPLATWANSSVNQRSFAKLDFMAVMDNFLTITAKAADLIIPAACPTEKYELLECISSTGEVYLNLSEAVLPAKGLNEVEFFKAMADLLGFGEAMPWQNSLTYFDYLLKPLKLNCQSLLQNSNGFHYAANRKLQDIQKENTSINLTVPKLAEYGYSTLPLPPVYEKPAADQIILTTCDKSRNLVHSRYRNVKELVKNEEPTLKLNPNTASSYQIITGDTVQIKRGEHTLLAKALVTENITEGTAAIMHGWANCNVNYFTRLEELDAISGFPNSAAIPISLKKYGG
jgi:anaerobic selenocysteine-containing dehydrogenase